VGAGLPAKAVAMECVICKHGKTHAGIATITLRAKSTVLVGKGVPADVCATCGEEGVRCRSHDGSSVTHR
jgi:YgiT-type zinc finger domain-containing protein